MSDMIDLLAAAGEPADIVLRRGAERLSRGTLLAAVERAADGLARLGLCAGEAVGVRTEHPLEFVVLALATQRAGGVPCPVAPGAEPPSPLARLACLTGGAPALTAPATTVPLPAGTAWLRATSGSSGSAKLVAVTAPSAVATARRAGALLGCSPGSVLVTSVAPWTSYGWNGAVLGPLLCGAEVRMVSPLAPRDLLAQLASGEAAWAVTTAPVVAALARLSPSGSGVTSRLLVSTARYPARDASEVRARHGIHVYDRYGATEAGPIAQAREPGGALHAAPGVEVSVVDGVAVVRSDGIGLGYVGGARFDGAFTTADRVREEADGGFRLEGRADRVVRRAGRPVDLAHVESTLAGLPGVALARVRPSPGRFDLDLEAEVVAVTDARLDGPALLRELARHLQPWERPQRITVQPSADGGKWSAA